MKSISRRVRIVTVLAVSMAMLATMWVAPGTAGAGGKGKPKPSEITLTLGIPPTVAQGPYIVAEGLGYYEDEGVDFKFEVGPGTGQVVQSLIVGDVSLMEGTPGPVMAALELDQGIRVPYCALDSSIFRVVALKTTGIKSFKDLKGKSIGIRRQTDGSIPLAEASIRDAGLTPNQDTRLVVIGEAIPQNIQAIRSGQVDAFSAGLPFIVILESAGLEFNDLTLPKFLETPGSCLFTTDEVLKTAQNRRAIQGVMRALYKAAIFMQANPEAAFQVACKVVPADCGERAAVNHTLFDQITAESKPDLTSNAAAFKVLNTALAEGGILKQKLSKKTIDNFLNGNGIAGMRSQLKSIDTAKIEKEAKNYKG